MRADSRRTCLDDIVMNRGNHPTAARLIEAVAQLAQVHGLEAVTVDEVLATSGVSRGSLYHHFADFPDLVDHALLAQYTELTDRSIVALEQAFEHADSAASYRASVRAVIASVHTPAGVQIRAARAWTIARATTRPGLRDLLGVQQARQTAALANVIRLGQARGWVRADLDVGPTAVLLQAINFGSILDDVSADHMDRDVYVSLIDHIVARAILVGND